MQKIITVAHQKGGVGKSTLAMNLALCFQEQLNVALVDTDLQGSLSHIKEDLPGLTLLTIEQLEKIKDLSFDLIVVDTPPYLSSKLPALFEISDFILIPTKAGFFDVLAVRSTIGLVHEARRRSPDIKAGVVMNMIKPRSGITKEVHILLESMDITLLNTVVHDRASVYSPLWLPVSNIFGAIIGKVQENMLKLDISQVQTAGDTFFSSTDTAYLIFLIIGIIGYFTVPTVANYIVSAGGGNGLVMKVNSLVISSVKSAGNAAGSVGGMIADTFRYQKPDFQKDPSDDTVSNPKNKGGQSAGNSRQASKIEPQKA